MKSLLLITVLTWFLVESKALDLNGRTFVITNKKYHRANLAQWGTGGRSVGTYEQGIKPDQLWLLEEDKRQPGYYYINNVHHDGYRLAKWGRGDRAVGVYNGQYNRDQLWKFVREGDYYRIYNKKYPGAKIAKWGKRDGDWGTYDGWNYDDQLWELTPRFLDADCIENLIYEFDNRGASRDISHKVTLTQGLKLTTSTTVSTSVGLETALKGAVPQLPGVGVTGTIRADISRSLSNGKEETWSKATETSYTAPAGKKFRVYQTVCEFESRLSSDNMHLDTSKIRTVETY